MRGRIGTLTLCAVMLFSILAGSSPLASATQDDCPNIVGTSTEDRHGCLDSDEDGWSDPDNDWTVADGADALPNIATQWTDLDGDGFGDNGDFDAEMIDHFPEDENLHRAVVSVGCNPPDHTIETGKSSHFTCTIKNEGANRLRVFIEWNASKGIDITSAPVEVILEARGISDDATEIRLSFDATSAGLSGGDLILSESSDSSQIYSIQLGVLVQDITPSISSGDPEPSLDPVLRQMTNLAGWMSAKSGRQVSVQMAIVVIVIIPFSLFVIGRRTQQSLTEKRKLHEEAEEEAATEEDRDSEVEEAVSEVSLEDMAAGPSPKDSGPKRGVKGAEGKVLDHSMVEVLVGNIDMPENPSDEFKVLTETDGDSDIGGEDWQDAHSDLTDDEEGDDDDFKVDSKHRTKSSKSEMEVLEPKTKSGKAKKKSATTSTKKKGAKSKRGKPDPSKSPKTQKSKKSQKSTTTDGGNSETLGESGPEDDPSERGNTPKKRGNSKRPKGKVGHTRGPGVDL